MLLSIFAFVIAYVVLMGGVMWLLTIRDSRND